MLWCVLSTNALSQLIKLVDNWENICKVKENWLNWLNLCKVKEKSSKLSNSIKHNLSKCIGKKNFDLFYCVKAIFSYYSIVLCVNFNLSLGKNSMSVVNIAQKIAFGKKIPCKLRFCSQRQKIQVSRPAPRRARG